MDNNENKSEVKKMPRPNNILRIVCDDNNDFFKWWCTLIRPLTKGLTNREMEVITSFLRQRWELSKHISDPAILDSVLMSEDTKRKVQEECHITLSHFYVVMSKLRNNGIIVNNTINPRLIPNIRNEEEDFLMMICIKGNPKKQ